MADLVIVPSALRQQRASRRLCDAQGGLLFGVRVATPRSLALGVVARAGESRSLLFPLAERLLAVSCAAEAGLIGEAPPASGSARAAADLIAELRHSEVSARDVRFALEAASGHSAERLRRVASALEIYERRLDATRVLDSAGALRAAAAAVRRGVPCEESELGLLALEGFIPPWPGTLDLVGALAGRARRVVARVPYFPGDPRRSAPAEPWVRRIESLHELAVQRDVGLQFPDGGHAAAVAKALGLGDGDAAVEGKVVALPASGDEEQAEGAARFAADLLEAGFAPEEVAAVAPKRLWNRLVRLFDRMAVPLAAAAELRLDSSAPVRDVRAALTAAGGLDRAGAECLLGSPYLAVGGEPLEGLALLFDRAGALDGRGDPEERLRSRARRLTASNGRARRERNELLRAARRIEQLRRELVPLGRKGTPGEWAKRVRHWIERTGVRRRAAQGEAELARRDLAALNRLEEVLDDLSRSLALAGRAQESLERPQWLALFDLAVGSASVADAPQTAAGAIELWPPEEAPGLQARAVLVLGAERGSWPVLPRSDPLLGDLARSVLNRHLARPALATSSARQAQGEYLGFSALFAAREVLGVAWTRGPAGEGPAPLAGEVLGRSGAPELELALDPPLSRARSASEALRAAMRLWSTGASAGVERPLSAACGSSGGQVGDDLAARARSAMARGAQERERRLAWVEGSVVGTSGGGLPPELGSAWRAALPPEWSATQLETHARCPYRFFLQVAGVPDGEAAGLDPSPREEGRLLHAALEACGRARRDRGDWPPPGTEAERAEVRRLASAVFARFQAEGSLGDPAAWGAREEVLLRRLEGFWNADAGEALALRPMLVEHEFGGSSGRPPLAIPAAAGAVLLRGRIDRVDADERRLLVIDYKNSRDEREQRERLTPGALGRTSFQPPLYLLAAARELPGRSEFQVTYGLLRSKERVDPWRTTPEDAFLELEEGRRAELRAAGIANFADAVVAAVDRIRSGVLPIASRDCRGCPFGAVCRSPQPGEGA